MSKQAFMRLLDGVGAVRNGIANLIGTNYLRLPIAIETLTYERAIRHVMREKPSDVEYEAAVMFRKRDETHWKVTLGFVDRNYRFVSNADGRTHATSIVVKGFDEELLRIFGESDVLVLR